MTAQKVSTAMIGDEHTISSEHPTNLQQFTLFLKLPAELRCKIWTYALPAPKWVIFHSYTAFQPHSPSGTACWDAFSQEEVPVCFFVCQEARAEILKVYDTIKSKTVRSRPTIYCGFKDDLFYFPDSVFIENMRKFLGEIDAKGKMRHMLVGEHLINRHWQWPDPARHIYELRNIEELVVLENSDGRRATSFEVCERAYSEQRHRKQEVGAGGGVELPDWVRKTVLPLVEELEALEKAEPTWKAPIVRWVGTR